MANYLKRNIDMSQLLTVEEMMSVGGGSSRKLAKAIKAYNKHKNSPGAKAARRKEKRCTQR